MSTDPDNQQIDYPFYYREEKVPENISDLIENVRKAILEDYETHSHRYAASDIELLRKDYDLWRIRVYLKQDNFDVKATMERLKSYFGWRLSHGFHLVCDQYFPTECYKLGLAFLYQPDRWGNTTLYVRANRCFPIKWFHEEERKLGDYFINKAYHLSDGNGVVVVADLTGASWANVNLNLIYLAMDAFLRYAPREVIRYVIIYNPPRMLSWLIGWVQSSLPSSMSPVTQVVYGDELFKFVSRENAPRYLGGTCPLNYYGAPEGCVSWRDKDEWGNGLKGNKLQKVFETYKHLLDQAAEEENKYFGCNDLE